MPSSSSSSRLATHIALDFVRFGPNIEADSMNLNQHGIVANSIHGFQPVNVGTEQQPHARERG